MRNDIIEFTSAYLVNAASVAGSKESEGPLRLLFDSFCSDDRFGQDTWEKSESEMVRLTLKALTDKCGIAPGDIDCAIGGDLLDQCVATSHAVNNSGVPYLGLYGACSTAAEAVLVASLLASTGRRSAAFASSHFCSAERQYRYPLEYGSQRTPTAQNTVTGCGAFLISPDPTPVRITEAVIGSVQDNGVSDANNMGAAMATAAVDTILRYFNSSGRSPAEFDIIATGDLGREGYEIACELLTRCGLDLCGRFTDCGMLIYDIDRQDVHAGGSGCGCSAAVFASYVCPRLISGEISKAVLIGTGALLSPISVIQNKIIPSVAHLVCFERC